MRRPFRSEQERRDILALCGPLTQTFDELLDRTTVEIQLAIRVALNKCQGSIVESDDIRQEIVAELWEHFDYIKSVDAPIACAQEIICRRAERCLRWLLPQYPPASEPCEGDKTVYDNDRERNLTGAQAVAYARSQEAGEDFNIADY